mgnify:CR=1 FL=1
MAKKIAQLRFPGSSISFKDGASWSDNLVEDLGTIMQVGIYALPGTKFKISQNEGAEVALIINGLGVFNMDVTDYPINSIKLSKSSYELISNNQFIIIDLVYEEGIK